MTNSIERSHAKLILNRWLAEFSEENLDRVINTPLDRAAEVFELPSRPDSTYEDFIHTTARFLQHLYENGIPIKQHLTNSQSLSEVFSALNKYQGFHGTGIIAAWFDVSRHYYADMEAVLVQMKEVVKQNLRERYTQWLLMREMSRLDWRKRCYLTEVLILSIQDHVSGSILDCEPEQLIDQIPALIQMHLNSSSQIRKILSNSFPS